jgi:CubicO group peptidase (beta-lactamase class C family)
MNRIQGIAKSEYIDVSAVLERILADKPDSGAAICAYVSGEAVVDLWGGPTYGPRTIQLLFSTTKGLTAIVFGRLLDAGIISLDEPVANYWPEFAAHGKGSLTVGDMLAHRGGLPCPDREFTLTEWADGTVASELAKQRPLWDPGAGHGYHAITYGVLANELVRRVDGRTIGEILNEEVSEPLGADAFIGLPSDREIDVAPVVRQEFECKPSWTGQFGAIANEHRPYALDENAAWNDSSYHSLEFPAVNGIASARALARIYSACIGNVDGSNRILEPATLRALTVERSDGIDLVGGLRTRFGAGFQLHTPLAPMSSAAAFGHDGFGGCVAFADPSLDLSFAYTTDRAPAIGGIDPACQALIAAVKSVIDVRGTAPSVP